MNPRSTPLDLGGHFPTLHLGEGLDFPTYFIVISLALCVCAIWLVRRTESRGLERNRALDLSLIVLFAGFAGSRAFHVLLEEPHYYWDDVSRVVEIWRGGFVWYGGALTGATAALAYLRWRRFAIGVWLDIFAPICALGYALGRVACLLTGCCYGAVCVLADGSSFRHPTQAYAMIWELGVLFLLLRLERWCDAGRIARTWREPGRLFLVWLGLHSIGRIIMESFRADPRGPNLLGLSQATWISLVMIMIVSIVFARDSRKRR